MMDSKLAMAQLDSQLQNTQAKFAKLVNARDMLDKVRVELTALTKLGDIISQDDVVKSAGNLVSHGLSPAAMAGILADAPESGEALVQWIAQQTQQVTQREAQLGPIMSQMQHQMGVQALHVMAAGHLDSQGGQDDEEDPSNPLIPPPDSQEQVSSNPLME